jgi:hypothetical protein
VGEELANSAGDALADTRERLQPHEPVRPIDLVDRVARRPNRSGRSEVCADAEWIRSLIAEEASYLFQTSGDVLVDRMHLAVSTTGSSKPLSDVESDLTGRAADGTG